MELLELSPLVPADSDLTLRWRQDPAVVAGSVSRERPTAEQHAAWMRERIFSPRWKVFIALDKLGNPVGMCTFKCEFPLELSYMVAPELRRRGFGEAIVGMAIGLCKERRVELLIRDENEASQRIAKKCGCREMSRRDGFTRFVRPSGPQP